MKSLALGAGLACLLAVSAAAQTMDDYLDYYIVKVKPEKRADFDQIARKIADANRKTQGDTWVAFETTYGENNTVAFVSTRKDMAAIDTGMGAFMKSLKETFGPNFESVLHDMDACSVSSRSEVRRRRWDLSINAPKTAEEYANYIGNARYIRTAAVRVRPGHVAEYEDAVRMIKAALEKREPETRSMISQSYAGQNGNTFYISSLKPNFAGFERNATPLKDLLGEEDYEKYQKTLAEAVLGSETMIGRILPSLSNPPEQIVNVTKDFWTPEPMPATAARSKKK